jgi:hypothetical protein
MTWHPNKRKFSNASKPKTAKKESRIYIGEREV